MEVDYIIPGCPINRDEFVKVVVALLQGKKSPIPDYPVCVECKKNENVCLFTIGKYCMGPIARAGCGAICPTNGNECEACRGYVSHQQSKAQSDVLKEYGLNLMTRLLQRDISPVLIVSPRAKVPRMTINGRN